MSQPLVPPGSGPSAGTYQAGAVSDSRSSASGSLGDLELRNVSVVYETVSGSEVSALQTIDLTVPNGQFLVVIGRSGCGKSTLLNVVSGLVKPTSGSISLGGKPVTGPGRDRGLVFQSDAVPSNWFSPG